MNSEASRLEDSSLFTKSGTEVKYVFQNLVRHNHFKRIIGKWHSAGLCVEQFQAGFHFCGIMDDDLAAEFFVLAPILKNIDPVSVVSGA